MPGKGSNHGKLRFSFIVKDQLTYSRAGHFSLFGRLPASTHLSGGPFRPAAQPSEKLLLLYDQRLSALDSLSARLSYAQQLVVLFA